MSDQQEVTKDQILGILDVKAEDLENQEQQQGKKSFAPDLEKASADGKYRISFRVLMNIHNPKTPFYKKTGFKLPNPDNPSKYFQFDKPKPVDGQAVCLTSETMYNRWKENGEYNELYEKGAYLNNRFCLVQIVKDVQDVYKTGDVFLWNTPKAMYDLINEKMFPTADQIKFDDAVATNVCNPFTGNVINAIISPDKPYTDKTSGKTITSRKWEIKEWSKPCGMLILNEKGEFVEAKSSTPAEKKASGEGIQALYNDPTTPSLKDVEHKEPNEKTIKLIKRALFAMEANKFGVDNVHPSLRLSPEEEGTFAAPAPAATEAKAPAKTEVSAEDKKALEAISGGDIEKDANTVKVETVETKGDETDDLPF